MHKREPYVALEISGDKLEQVVGDLRDNLINEFWRHLPEGKEKDEIKLRLEKNILLALTQKAKK